MEKYYYLRDRLNRPTVTICLIKIDKDIARGIAVCSLQDMPCKKIGRAIARGRATKALTRKASYNYIGRVDVAQTIPVFHCKATYMPHLSQREKLLLESK